MGGEQDGRIGDLDGRVNEGMDGYVGGQSGRWMDG